MVASLPDEFVKAFAPMIEGFGAMPDEVMIRFGMWEQILAARSRTRNTCRLPMRFIMQRGRLHLARRVGRPRRGRSRTCGPRGLKKIPAARSSTTTRCLWLFRWPTRCSEGELLFFEGKSDPGIAKLSEAVILEDALHYDEPPAWMIPARHVLGAALMKAGKVDEAGGFIAPT